MFIIAYGNILFIDELQDKKSRNRKRGKKMQKMKRVLALFLAVATVWTGMPVSTVLAQENVTEQSEESVAKEVTTEEATTTEETATEETTQQTALINYVVVDSNYITSPGTQKIVVGIGSDDTVVENAVLTYVNQETQEQYAVQATQSVGGAVLFSVDFTEGQSGTYSLKQVEYTVDGIAYTCDLSASGFDAKFGVDKEVETQPDAEIVDEEDVSSDIVTIDENGNINPQNSMEDALQSAEETVGKSVKGAGNIVVVLDPGHDNTHAGAHQSGLKEEELNLKIAKYCKAELEQYAGVTVYLSRPEDGSCPHPGTSSTDCNAGRVAYAKSVGANVYVSLHLNSNGNTSAHGAEIYYPNNNYNSSIGAAGGQLADSILNQLGALGLNVRGKKTRNSGDNTTYPDGSLADYYGVIRRSKLEGIPAIIVEHAFMTNAGDVNTFLNNEDGLRRLGVADATGIAAYFGLQKKSALQLNGIFYSEKCEWIEAGVSWQATSQPVQFRWLAYSFATGTWTTVSDWSQADYITWRPQKGNYWLRVEAKSADGAEANWTMEYESKRDFTKHYVDISGIYCQEDNYGIRAGAVHSTTDTGAKFRWMVYDINKGTWTTISDWNQSEWVNWKPEKGNYWLRVEAMTSDGVASDYTVAYNPKRGYAGKYVEIDGIYCEEVSYGIRVGAVHTTNDSAVQYRWMVYDINKGTWTTMTNWQQSEWMTWTPVKGNYWLRVEAKTSTGKTTDYTIAYNPSRGYNYYYVNLQGIYAEENNYGIRAGAVHETNDNLTVYRWMVYDVNKGTWTTISDWNQSEWVNWKPEKSNYWLRVEARSRDGVESNYTIAYNPARDYSHYYVDIQGIYAEESVSGIRAGAVHVTNDSGAKYRWMVYDINKGTWTTITDWNQSEWTNWNPEAGDYWLRVEAMTTDGRESDYTIAKRIERYNIMGNSSTNLSQMVAYYRKNAVYPSYYLGSDAPNIESFCQIYIEECAAEGVKAEVAFAQAMKETGFLRFGGQVSITQYNFAGLGATDGGAAGASFPNVRTGVRAQIQHLKAYASTDALKNPCVDPRFNIVKRGTAPYVEWLGQKENPQGYGWATAQNYGYSIKNDYIRKLLTM